MLIKAIQPALCLHFELQVIICGLTDDVEFIEKGAKKSIIPHDPRLVINYNFLIGSI